MKDILLNPLLLPIWVPFAAGLLCRLLPRALDKVSSYISLLASAGLIGLAWPLFRSGSGSGEYGAWFSLSNDNLSGFMLLAVAVFGFLIAMYSLYYMKGRERLAAYNTYILWTLAAASCTLLANDLILLLIGWGFLGFTLYMLIGLNGPEASAAAKKSFIIVGGADALLVLGAAILWQVNGSTRLDLPALAFTKPSIYAAFLGIAAAAFAKAGAMPLHTWIPDCAAAAPIPVTAFLPASLDKLLGIYLLARSVTSLFQLDGAMQNLLMAVGGVTILLAVMMALVQHDLKRLLAFHAVSQVGYMVLGIGTGNPLGLAGALFHMLNHAIYKSCLFLGAGSVEKSAGGTDLDRLGGLHRALPVTFVSFLVAAFAISGVPPFNGFASKWMIYQSLLLKGGEGGQLWVVWLAVAMLGSALTLASFVKLLHAVFLCPPSPEISRAAPREGNWTMKAPLLFLALLCLLFGVAAQAVPLKYLIVPALAGRGIDLPGIWWSGTAAALLLAALGLGLVLYLFSSTRKARTCPTYIGGENLAEAYIQGEPAGSQRHLAVTGTEFYNTVQELPVIRRAYQLAAQKTFDLYEVGSKIVFYFVEALRRAHTGLLPQYLTWLLAGLLLIALFLMKGAR